MRRKKIVYVTFKMRLIELLVVWITGACVVIINSLRQGGLIRNWYGGRPPQISDERAIHNPLLHPRLSQLSSTLKLDFTRCNTVKVGMGALVGWDKSEKFSHKNLVKWVYHGGWEWAYGSDFYAVQCLIQVGKKRFPRPFQIFQLDF